MDLIDLMMRRSETLHGVVNLFFTSNNLNSKKHSDIGNPEFPETKAKPYVTSEIYDDMACKSTNHKVWTWPYCDHGPKAESGLSTQVEDDRSNSMEHAPPSTSIGYAGADILNDMQELLKSTFGMMEKQFGPSLRMIEEELEATKKQIRETREQEVVDGNMGEAEKVEKNRTSGSPSKVIVKIYPSEHSEFQLKTTRETPEGREIITENFRGKNVMDKYREFIPRKDLPPDQCTGDSSIHITLIRPKLRAPE